MDRKLATATVGNRRIPKRGCHLLAFILSLQIYDLYQLLPEAPDDPLNAL